MRIILRGGESYTLPWEEGQNINVTHNKNVKELPKAMVGREKTSVFSGSVISF